MNLDRLYENFYIEKSVQSLVELMAELNKSNETKLAEEIGEIYKPVFGDNYNFMLELGKSKSASNEAHECFQKALDLALTDIDREIAMNFASTIGKNLVQNISKISPKLSNNGIVCITMTSCKRFDLFQRTVESFIHCCSDLNLVKRWICVDDHSSFKDRIEMKRLYPFIEFHYKAKKGHPSSMNLIRKLVESEQWVFHLEDDWEFKVVDNYLTKCISILSQSEEYGQCLLNRNYAETFNDIDIRGGEWQLTDSRIPYIVHTYSKDLNNRGRSCEYWPHYSLRVGMTKGSVFRNVGEFNETADHFELEYAERYTNLGFKTTFLAGIFAVHIGKLTSEKDVDNAYSLNDQPQFRRPSIMVITPEDGSELVLDENIIKIFGENPNRGVVGQALHHLKAWVELASGKVPSMLIVEDNIEYSDSIDKITNKIMLELTKKTEWDLIIWGHTENENENEFRVEKLTSLKTVNSCSSAYTITDRGVMTLLQFVKSNGIPKSLDDLFRIASDYLRIFYIETNSTKLIKPRDFSKFEKFIN